MTRIDLATFAFESAFDFWYVLNLRCGSHNTGRVVKHTC